MIFMLSQIIEQSNIDKVEQYLSNYNKIVIVSHVSPDGDAIGSSLGMYHFLKSFDKDVTVIYPNSFPDFLRWMPASESVLKYDRHKKKADEVISHAEMIFCLDFNALSRIDVMKESIEKSSAKKVMIDHHLNPEPFCDVTISHPSISSTSELVYRLINRLGDYEEITLECAQCIYTGMMTDTGGFTYNSNNKEIYYIISSLLAKGIDKDDIYRKVYNTYSEDRLRLMGYVLYEKMQVFNEFNAALIWLTRDEQKKFSFVKGDTEGFVNIPLSIKHVKFSVFLREDTEKDMIKVSLRSVGTFPCNKVANEFFNGGGHLNASGGEVFDTMENAISLFKQAIIKYEDLLTQKE